MKKSLFAIPVLVVMAGIGVSCQKESESLRNDNQNQEFRITAIIADTDTKVSHAEDGETHALKQEWEIGDIIFGCDDDKHTYGFELESIKENGEAIFRIITKGEYAGSLTSYPTVGVTLHMIYAPGKKPTDIDVDDENNNLMSVSITNQYQDEFPAFMTADGTATKDGVRLCFKNQMAVIGIKNPTMAAAETPYDVIAISGENIYTRVNFIRTGGKIVIACDIPGVIKKAVDFTSDASKNVSGVAYIVVCPLSTPTDIVFTTNYLEAYKKTGKTMDAGSYYYMTPTFSGGHVDGVLPGLFTSYSGRVVAFSRGNVYYDCKDSMYKFEANQYDYRHYCGVKNDAAVINGESTTTPDGTVGSLFWVKNNETAIKPYDKKYGTPAPDNTSSDVIFTNADITTPNPDFTVEGTKGVWRALTGVKSGEFRWIIGDVDASGSYPGKNYRETGIVNGTANALFARATVNGVRGLILFPDIYFHPSELSGKQPVNINEKTADYKENDYTAEEWSKMESAGAVFLPFAGMRKNTSISMNAVSYWGSSTSSGTEYEADLLNFNDGTDWITSFYSRNRGFSIRLVMEVQ